MKKFLRVIVFAIVLVIVNTQTLGGFSSQPFSTAIPQLFSSGISDLSSQFYTNGLLQLNQALNPGYYSQPFLGLSQQDPKSLGYQPYTNTPNFYKYIHSRQLETQLGNLGVNNNNGGPPGGRSASRAIRLQNLYTKAVPSLSNSVSSYSKEEGALSQSKFDPSYIFQSTASPDQTSPNEIATSPSPTLKQLSPLQVSSTINSVPAQPTIATAPPLPPVPSSSLTTKDTRDQEKSILSSDTAFSIASSIPIAEGHSVGNNVAFTYNTGLNSFGSGLNSISSTPSSFPAQPTFAPFAFNSFGSNLGSSLKGSSLSSASIGSTSIPFSSGSSLSSFNLGSSSIPYSSSSSFGSTNLGSSSFPLSSGSSLGSYNLGSTSVPYSGSSSFSSSNFGLNSNPYSSGSSLNSFNLGSSSIPYSGSNSFGSSNFGLSSSPYSSSNTFNSFNTGSGFQNSDSHFGSFGSFGYNSNFDSNSASNFGSSFGDSYSRLFNNVYKRDLKQNQDKPKNYMKNAAATN